MLGKAAAGSGFRGLVNYLVLGKLGKENPDRVLWSDVRNLAVNDPVMAPRIMRATANQSTRADEPVYHLIVSWSREEDPSEQVMRQVGHTTLEDLKLQEHQALMIAHDDTDHKHLHIVVNRIHPEKLTAWDRWKDWPKIEKSLGRQAKELGLRYVPGRHNEPEAFQGMPKRVRSKEYRMAERLGTVDQLRPRWTKEQIAGKRAGFAETIEKSGSWKELARALAVDGITLERKGQGIVLGDATGTMKLSDLKKDIRLKPLEARFGQTWAEYEHARDQEPALDALMKQDDDASADDSADAQTNASPQQKPRQEAPAMQVPPPTPEDAEQGPPLEEIPANAAQKLKVGGEETSGATQASASPQPRKIKLPPIAGATESAESASQGRAPEGPEQEAQVEPDAPPMDRAEFAAKWQAKVKKAEEKEAARQVAPTPKMDPAEFTAKWQAKMKSLEEREAEKKRKAELELQQKMAETERERERDTRLPAPAKARQTTSLTPTMPERPRLPDRKVPALGPNAAALAFEAKQKADEEADLAYRMHGMGLVTRRQLAHSVRQKAEACAEADKHRTPGKLLQRELREALTPDTHKTEQEPKKDKALKKKRGPKMSM